MVCIKEAMSSTLAADLHRRSLELAGTHGARRDGMSSGGGRSIYDVLDGFVVNKFLPELIGWYEATRWFLEELVGRDVILSPFPRSAVNVNVYRPPLTGVGWHFDTNPLSVLLYLSEGNSPTEFQLADDRVLNVTPHLGDMLVFLGRKIRHQVPLGSGLRITCPLNYYHPDDCSRPEWIDRAIYENSDFHSNPKAQTTDAG